MFKLSQIISKNDITEFHQDGILAIMKCRHVEYPNSTLRKGRLCETPLSTQMRLVNGKITNRPNLIYPFAPIQQQLAVLYRQPDFERSLRHWTSRTTFNNNILTDIYDGQLWKTLKETRAENSPKFF